MNKKVFLTSLLAIVGLLSSCSTSSTNSSSGSDTSGGAIGDYSGVYSCFNSTFDVRLYTSAKKENLTYIGSYLTSLSNELDAYTVPEEGVTTLYTINHSNEAIKVSDALFDALSFAFDMKTMTEGYLNPLVGAITTLWKDNVVDTKTQATKADVEAVEAQLPTLLAEVNSSSLVLDSTNKTVQRKGNALVDLGALGKGYALRHVQSYLKENNIGAYLVNGGSSSMIFGTTKKSAEWKISFADCKNAYFMAKDTAIGTSSIDQQGTTVDGTIYTHIVNPFTGSAVANYTMCTIKGNDPGYDDVLSTIYMIAGTDKAEYFKNKFSSSLSYNFEYGFYTSATNTWVTSTNMGVEGI
jgi:thiamine biosynthesis lipoprotein ApbE